MMTETLLRPANERFHTEIDWLESRHTFSFAEHYDPKHLGFRALRVINDDVIAPASGFGTHGHRDMEIVTWVLDGELQHKDSLGTGLVIRPGDIQRMSAGTGVRHSEWNPSEDRALHLLQIWIVPERTGLPASYEEKHLDPADLKDRLRLIASRDARAGSVTIHQDVSVYAGRLSKGAAVEQAIAKGRHAWVHVAKGGILLNGTGLEGGDGAALDDPGSLRIAATADSEVILFDLA